MSCVPSSVVKDSWQELAPLVSYIPASFVMCYVHTVEPVCSDHYVRKAATSLL